MGACSRRVEPHVNAEESKPIETNTTMHDAMWSGHGGWEMAFTPFLLGGVGWILDTEFGTMPLFVIIGATLGLFGSVANQYYRYTSRMEVATAKRMAAHADAHGTDPSRPAFSANPVVELPDYVLASEVDESNADHS